MRQKLYDQYYRALDLEPGASLEDIDRMWHLLVQVWHPDRLPPGTAVYQHAVKRMQDINVARDELRAYWQANGHAPPVGSTGSGAAPRPQPSPASGPTSPPPPPAPSNSTTPPPPPAGPALPAFQKTWIHYIYDYMDKNATESNPGLAVAFGFALLVASFGLARVLLLPIWPMDHEYTNQDNMAILVIAFIIFVFLFRLMYASYEVYKLLEKPFFEAVQLSPDAARQRIVASLEATRYNDHVWNIQSGESADATAGGAGLVTATMQLAEAVVTLNAHIWPSQLAGWSVIGLEFDADHPWRIAAPYAPVRVTNEAIIASLNAPAR